MGKDAENAVEASQTKLPNSRHCFGCGVENSYGLSMAFYEVGPNRVASDITPSISRDTPAWYTAALWHRCLTRSWAGSFSRIIRIA